MIIRLSKFGSLLISRPSGREAFLSAKAYLITGKPKVIELDFQDVKVLTPSWIDEFVNLLQDEYPESQLKFGKSENKTVKASLKMLR